MSTNDVTTADVATLGTIETERPALRKAAEAKTATAAHGKVELKKKIGIAAAVLAALGAGYYGYQSFVYTSTDNATIEGKTTLLSPRVGGIVVSSLVEENQVVKQGQVLARIRSVEYENALNQARAERESLAAELKNAERAYLRTQALVKQGAMTQERLDAAEAQFHSLTQRLKAAESQVSQAELNLADTEIVAPADGTIAKKSFEVGMMAQPGQPLMGFVAGNERWATANFKETEMKGIAPGKEAEVEVDAISGRTFHGVVESISPSTGAIFSLLPPDNATGNFTKVVQRVPVRVKLTGLSSEDVTLLQAGLSAEVTVRVR